MKVTSYTFCGKINIPFHDNLKYIKTKLVNPPKKRLKSQIHIEMTAPTYCIDDSLSMCSVIQYHLSAQALCGMAENQSGSKTSIRTETFMHFSVGKWLEWEVECWGESSAWNETNISKEVGDSKTCVSLHHVSHIKPKTCNTSEFTLVKVKQASEEDGMK